MTIAACVCTLLLASGVAAGPAGSERVTGESGGVVNLELLHDLVAMFFDSLERYAEIRGDRLIGAAAAPAAARGA